MEGNGTFLGTDIGLWKDVFRRFATISRLSPWGWFGEGDCFAVHPQGYAEPFFIHRSDGRFGTVGTGIVIVYSISGEALYRRLQAGIPHAATRSFEIPFVLCAMRKADKVTSLERSLCEQAGGQAGADGSLPVFVSFRPGWMPWHLSTVEVKSTAAVLDQALGVFLRAETDRALLYPPGPPRALALLARRQQGEGKGHWSDASLLAPAFTEPFAKRDMEVPAKLLESAGALPDEMGAVELACDVIPKIALLNPETVKLRGEDGRIPLGYFFAVCPHGGGPLPTQLSDNGVFYPASDIGSLYKFFPNMLVKMFLAKKRRPKEIFVSSQRMMQILRPLQPHIGFRMTFNEKLPHYDALRDMVARVVAEKVK